MTTMPSPEHEATEPAAAKDDAIDWIGEIRGLVLMLAAVLAFHSVIAKPFYIPSISMMPNLLVGDRLIVSKFPYGWNWSSVSFHLLPRGDWRMLPGTPDYGDIVIVVPRNREEDLIKRVVARPGDRIALRDGHIILNGKPIAREVVPSVQLDADEQLMCGDGPFMAHCYETFANYRTRLPSGREVYELPAWRETMPNGASYIVIDELRTMQDTMPEITVPPGHVFLMGDNRDHSADSRIALDDSGLGGPVPLSDVGGRAEFTTFSLNGSETLNPLTWWGALRDGRAWRSLRPVHVRETK